MESPSLFRKLSVLRSIAIPAAAWDLSRLAGVRSSDFYLWRSKSHIPDDKNHIQPEMLYANASRFIANNSNHSPVPGISILDHMTD